MLNASAPNVGALAPPMHAMRDRWGIHGQTKVLGYWDKTFPVKTNTPDIFASLYANEGKSLIGVATWAPEPTSVTLTVDWQTPGLDPGKVRVSDGAAASDSSTRFQTLLAHVLENSLASDSKTAITVVLDFVRIRNVVWRHSSRCWA
jgi:hypothetical protein